MEVTREQLQQIYLEQAARRTHCGAADLGREVEELHTRLADDDCSIDAYVELARCLEERSEVAAALDVLREGCQRLPSPTSHWSLVHALMRNNRSDEALIAARSARRLFPENAATILQEALILPILYDAQSDVRRHRVRFMRGLKELNSRVKLDTPAQRQEAFAAVAAHTNFYLAYQGGNDRELQRQYAAMVQRIVAANLPDCVVPCTTAAPTRGERIRVGYLSAHFYNHSVSKTFLGWLEEHDRDRFEVFAYQFGDTKDGPLERARRASDCFRHLTGDLRTSVRTIRADRLHVAVFVDVGMAPVMTLTASLKLAPVQCATWGHPVTTGSAAIDFYLSSELMEPPNGDDHYTERLVRLPGVGVCFRNPIVPRALLDRRRSAFGLRDDATVYLCCQSLFKYLPQHDDVFVKIAASVPGAQFVFVSHNGEAARDFDGRLERAFARAGLAAANHCVVLPALGQFDYWNLNLTGDVFLDSLDWSGCVSSFEAIACGVPLVTLPGHFMRGRHTHALLTQMGISETIARDKAGYISIATRLGLDAGWRRHVLHRTASARSQLFGDRRSVDALEHLYCQALRGNTPAAARQSRGTSTRGVVRQTQ